MELHKLSKILVIRLSSLGDILLTTPLLRTLKTAYPNTKIDFLVRNEYQDTLKHNPNIDNLLLLDRNYERKLIRRQLIENGYDLILDLQNNLRSRLLTFGTVPVFRYKKPYIKRFLLVKLKINKFKEKIPIPVRYANAIPGFNLDDQGLELFLSDEAEVKINSYPKAVGLCPGSRHLTKMWPMEYYIKLGKLLNEKGYQVLLFGGKDDIGICKEISERVEGSIDYSNDNKLLDLAANMKKCGLVVCNDSGMMHTALALDLPVLAIFGSTVEELGFFPYKGKNLVLENKSLSCRPCSHIGRDKCPLKHLDCLNKITPDYVFSELNRFLDTL